MTVLANVNFYFAWAAEAEAFNATVHNREDEQIFEFEIEHAEGEFASLKITVRNPKVGLLGAGRNLWAWLSWDGDAGSPAEIKPLFYGRLVGFPERIYKEKVELKFRARPNDYDDDVNGPKAIAAEALKVPPQWDTLFVQDNLDDPDTVLEAYPAAWHINRTTLAVTASDLLVGEDGTIDVSTAEHFYDDLSVSYSNPPTRKVKIEATVTWTQKGTGTVDITKNIVEAFQGAGSPMEYPLVSSMTGGGLLDSWPKPGDSLGTGWQMGSAATAVWAEWVDPPLKTYIYVKPSSDVNADKSGETTIDSRPGKWTYSYKNGWRFAPDKSQNVSSGGSPATFTQSLNSTTWETWGVIYPLGVISINFPVDWTAERKRSEVVSFEMQADIQPLLANPDEKVTLSSEYVDKQIDIDLGSPSAMKMPIGDQRRNAFFITDRGRQALEYLISYGRAKLRSKARAIEVEFGTKFSKLSNIDCRWSATVHDDRLPGGQATGKITKVVLKANGDTGELKGTGTIGVAIGNGGTISVATGTAVYAESGYVDSGYQIMNGETIDPGTADVTYSSLDETTVDDDGVDLFNLTNRNVVQSITITDGVTDQLAALAKFKGYTTPPKVSVGGNNPSNFNLETPGDVLKNHYTKVTLNLKKISSQSFETDYAPTLSMLVIPQGINLEAV